MLGSEQAPYAPHFVEANKPVESTESLRHHEVVLLIGYLAILKLAQQRAQESLNRPTFSVDTAGQAQSTEAFTLRPHSADLNQQIFDTLGKAFSQQRRKARLASDQMMGNDYRQSHEQFNEPTAKVYDFNAESRVRRPQTEAESSLKEDGFTPRHKVRRLYREFDEDAYSKANAIVHNAEKSFFEKHGREGTETEIMRAAMVDSRMNKGGASGADSSEEAKLLSRRYDDLKAAERARRKATDTEQKAA